MALKDRIKKIETFKRTLANWFRPEGEINRPTVRAWLNQNKKSIEREVFEAGCLKRYTLAPPPAVGGMIMKDLNPFDMMFESSYGESPIPIILDMLDETIGVMSDPTYENEMVKVSAILEEAIQEGIAFIAMPMDPRDPSLVDTLDAIKEACNRVGVNAERIDDDHSNERITDRMLESIRHAEYVIADLTNSKPNVYYEAGYALGYGNTPIYIARAGTELEFDLKDYPVLFFESYKELKDKLENRMRGLTDKKTFSAAKSRL
jgi:nucleoside 2-deoxyribosyltransferase